MNRKNTLIFIFMVLGALVVSAFSVVAITNENNQASLQRGREADAARYTAMAEYLTAKDGANLQRGREADAARYTAMARYFEAQNSNPVGLMRYYYKERNSYAAAASGTDQQGLEIYYQSERNSAPAPTFHYGPPGR